MNAYTLPGKYTIDQAVCKCFEISIDRLLATDRKRKREEVEARQYAMWLNHYFTKKSLAEIGLKYGGRDHATVLHAVKTVNGLIEFNKPFAEKSDECLKMLELTKK